MQRPPITQALNLINPKLSSVTYEAKQSLDGEKRLVITGEINREQDMHIICRITSADDLYILMQAADILTRQGVLFSIFITYLMGMGTDKVTDFNQPFTLGIIANIINSLHPIKVVLVEPYSYRAIALIKNCEARSLNIASIPTEYLCTPDENVYDHYIDQLRYLNSKVDNAADQYKGALIGLKDKDTGEYKVINADEYEGGTITVLDCLCDDGEKLATIAQILREMAPEATLKVHVTHMVNEQAIALLSKSYDEVEFSDSYTNWTLSELPDNVRCQLIWNKEPEHQPEVSTEEE